jgi:hypothetical protein
MPDYSHFQSRSENYSRLGIAAVKMESHQHREDGGWHLVIEVRLGPQQRAYMEAIKNGFHAMMQALSPAPPVAMEDYSGAEADREALRSIEDYYQQARRDWIDPLSRDSGAPDPWRSN